MSELITYTADDEQPDCNRCEYVCGGYDCENMCGAKHGWNGYERIEVQEE